jgi:2-hydroxy-3-keto-5-methylthiopentenyl-1-phosphate phosphatase
MDVAVVVDFDGTVTEEEVSRLLLERFARGGWVELERRLEAGELTVKEAKAREFEMMEAPEAEMRAFVRGTARLRNGFPEFVSHLRGLGFPLAIASEGLDIYVNEVLEANGIDYGAVFCNTFTRGREGGWKVGFPRPSPECDKCGHCKLALVRSLKADGNYVVYIGNGRTDHCPSREANIVFARGWLADALEGEGRSFVLFEDFFDVMQAWDSVLAHKQA